MLDPTKTYKHRKVEPRLSAERPAETYSRKKEEKKRKIEEKRKESIKERSSPITNPVSFSNEKIERMKKLAQMLSQKIVNTKSPEKNKQTPSKSLEESNLGCSERREEDVVLISDEDNSHTTGSTFDVSRPSTSKADDCTRASDKTHKKKRKHKDKKKRHQKHAKFEGETVPYLVKTGEGEAKNEDEEEKNYATQDEYVLQKLFSRSGMFILHFNVRFFLKNQCVKQDLQQFLGISIPENQEECFLLLDGCGLGGMYMRLLFASLEPGILVYRLA